jgi:Glycosyltransferase family 87
MINWTERPRKEKFRAVAWLVVVVYLLGFSISAAMRNQSDFNIYREAGFSALHRQDIYSDPASPFRYAPLYATIFIPLAMLPLRTARLFWFMISMAAALPALLLGSARLLFGKDYKLSGELILIPLILCTRFILPNFDHGQINLIVFALLVWGLALALETKALTSGALLAASSLIKPLSLVPILYLVVQRRLLVILSIVAAIVAFLCLPVIIIGTNYTAQQTNTYLKSVVGRLSPDAEELQSDYNQSAAAVAARILSGNQNRPGLLKESNAVAVGTLFHFLVVALVFAWCRIKQTAYCEREQRLALAAIFCVIPATLIVSWLEYDIALIVPYMALTYVASSQREQNKKRSFLAACVLCMVLVLNVSSRLFKPALFYGVPYFTSVILLVALVALVQESSRVSGGELASGNRGDNTRSRTSL